MRAIQDKFIQGEPDLNWQRRCRKPSCSQLHYPLVKLFFWKFCFYWSSGVSSKSPRVSSFVFKIYISTIWSPYESITISIFSTVCRITYSFSWSFEEEIHITLRIGVFMFDTIVFLYWNNFANHLLLLGNLLFLFEDTHFIGSRHLEKNILWNQKKWRPMHLLYRYTLFFQSSFQLFSKVIFYKPW